MKSFPAKATIWAMALTLSVTATYACLHLAPTYKGAVGQNTQEAVLIHHNGREELVLGVKYEIEGSESAEKLAWVITVPNEPDAYNVADPKLFEEMFDFSRKLTPQPKSNTLGPIALGVQPAGVELGKSAAVGPYDIQPVRGVGPDALQGLNDWMTKNGFSAFKASEMAYFVENKFTFLAVKINPAKNKKEVGKNGSLPPLHLSFATDRPYYPLRLSSGQGVFDLNLHILTKEKIDFSSDTNKEILDRLKHTNPMLPQNKTISRTAAPKTLQAVFNKSSTMKGITGDWHYTNLSGIGLNEQNSISAWKTDIFFGDVKQSEKRRKGTEKVGTEKVSGTFE